MLPAITFRGATLDWLRPYVMGVVNVTPDSFSDGGKYLGLEAAVSHGLAMVEAGADLLDVGGEATGPRATPVTAEDELRRVIPVIEALAARTSVPLSVDTTKAEVARAAVAAGAEVINDVSGGLFDPQMAAAVADTGAAYVCTHLRGRSLAEVFAAEGAVEWPDVARELRDRLAALPDAARARTLVDPGLGFGKGADPAGNAALIAHAGDLSEALGRPVLVGPSRKRFLARLIGRGDAASEAERDAATIGACLAAVKAGAHVLRVHDVQLLNAALIAYTRI
jgi:dihydropteroate synthase